MHTLNTPNATVHHASDFSVIKIELKDPARDLDIMDIKEIYAAFFRDWLRRQVDELGPDAIINLGYAVGRNQDKLFAMKYDREF